MPIDLGAPDSAGIDLGEPDAPSASGGIDLGAPDHAQHDESFVGPVQQPPLSLYTRGLTNANIRSVGSQSYGPVDAVGDALGWIGGKGRELANLGYQKAQEYDKLPFHEGREMLSRAMLSPFLGPKISEEQPDASRINGINQLEGTLGSKGTTAALTTANMVAQVPQMVVGLGWGQKGAQAVKSMELGGKFIPKIAEMVAGTAGSAAEGALVSGAMAKIAGEPVRPAMVSGAGFAGALHVGGAALETAVPAIVNVIKGIHKKYKPVGVLPTETMHGVGDEIGNFDIDVQPPEPHPIDEPAPETDADTEQFVQEEVPEKARAEGRILSSLERHKSPHEIGAATLVRPGDLKPSVVTVTISAKNQPVARVVEINTSGESKYYDIPLNNAADALKARKLVDDHGIAITNSDRWFRQLQEGIPQDVADALYATPHIPAPEPNFYIPLGKTRSEVPVIDLDKAPVDHVPPAIVAADDAGHVKLQPVDPPPQNIGLGAKIGDKVFVTRGGGRVPGVFAGVSKNGNIEVMSLVPGEKKKFLLSEHDIVLADPAEHTAAVQAIEDRKNSQPTGTMRAPTPPEPPLPTVGGSTPRPFKKGEIGYLANVGGEGYTVVRIEGQGSTPGTVLVRANEGGSAYSVSTGKVDRELPPGIQSYEGVAPATQDAPPPPDSLTFSPEQVDQFTMIGRLYKRVTRTAANAWDAITRQMISGQNRGPKDLAIMVQMKQGAAALLKAEGDHLAAAQKLLPKGSYLQGFDNDLGKVAQGKMSMAEFETKHGEAVTADLKKYTESFIAERDANDQRIADLGGIPDRLIMERAAGLEDPYLARMYWVNMLPAGKWAKVVPGDVFNNAVAFMVAEMGKGGQIVSPTAVASELGLLLKAGNVAEGLKSGAGANGPTSRAMNKLLAKKDIPAPIRELMGEVQAGSVRMAATMGAQRSIIASLEIFQGIADDVNLSNLGPRPDLHPEPVPNNRRMFGNLAGRYVKPEIFRELITLPQTIHNNYTLAHAISGWLKGNQVAMGGPSPWINSLFGNFQSAIYSGGGSLVHPVQWGKDVHSALQALKDYHVDPSGKTGNGWVVVEAKKMGVDWSGFGDQEIAPQSRKFVQDALRILDKEKGAVDIYTIGNALKKVTLDPYRNLQGKLGGVLDAQDRAFRIGSYIALRRKYQAQGMPEVEAAKQAAHLIAQSYWNPQYVGPFIQKLRGTVGIGAPYLTSFAEEGRVLGTTVYRLIKNEEPDLKWRLLANAAVVGGIAGAGGLLRHWNGIREEDIELAHRSMSKRQQAYRPGAFVLPWRDEHGRPQVMDVTQYFLPFKLLQGHPDDSWFARLAQNLMESPFQGSLAGSAIQESEERAGLKRPLPDRDLLEGERNLNTWTDWAWKTGFGPKYVQTAQDIARRTMVGGTPNQPVTVGPGTMGRNEEPLTPVQAGMQASGLKVNPVGDRAYRGASSEAVGEISDLVKHQLKTNALSTRSPEEKKRNQEAIIKRMYEVADQQRLRNDALQRVKNRK